MAEIKTTGPIISYKLDDFQVWNAGTGKWQAPANYTDISCPQNETIWRLKPGATPKFAYVTDDDEYLHDSSTGTETYGKETSTAYMQTIKIKDASGKIVYGSDSRDFFAQSGAFDLKTATDTTGTGGKADQFTFANGEMDVIHIAHGFSSSPTVYTGWYLFRSGVPKPGVIYKSGVAGVNNSTASEDDAANPTGGTNYGSDLTLTGVKISQLACFVTGTEIATEFGMKPVEEIMPGDMVLTRDNGFKPVIWSGNRTVCMAAEADPEKRFPICIRAGALGAGTPKRDLYVSRQHRVLVKSKIARNMFGTDEILLPAFRLVGLAGVEVVRDCDEVTYVHFLFDQHEIVYSNGAETESLYTGPEALKSVGNAAREEILALFPELADIDYKALPVRPLPGAAEARKLIERHKSKGRCLVEAH